MRGRLDLDFARPRRRASPLGLALLGGGAVVLAASAASLASAAFTESSAAARLAATASSATAAQDRQRLAQRVAPDPARAARMQAGRQAARLLDSPWGDLLDAAEQLPSEDATLLGIEPSALKRTITITAEAREATTMLEHLALLQHDPRLSHVVIVSHQRQVQVPGAPWRYQIQGTW